MQITSSSFGGRNVIFDYIYEDIPGGVSLDKTRLKTGTEEIEAGTPVYVNKSTRVAEIVKTSKAIASSSANAVRVSKDDQWIVGEFVTDGLVVQEITSITTTNDDYDILNLGGNLLIYAENTVIYEAAAAASLPGAGDVVSAVVEGASGHTLTISDPTGQSVGMKVVLARAADDNLVVAYASGTLTITLANSTANKNTAALIQAAIRALVNAEHPFGSFVCVGASWSEDGSTITTAADYMEATQPEKYIPNGFVKETVNVEYDNADVSVVFAGAVREGSLPYPLTTAFKSAMSKFTFNS